MVLNEGLKPFFVVGLLFPLHIILGVACVPALLYYLWCGSAVTKILLLCYLPLFLWPASTAYPGWKGFEAMWKWFDYTATCTKYFGLVMCLRKFSYINPAQMPLMPVVPLPPPPP